MFNQMPQRRQFQTNNFAQRPMSMAVQNAPAARTTEGPQAANQTNQNNAQTTQPAEANQANQTSTQTTQSNNQINQTSTQTTQSNNQTNQTSNQTTQSNNQTNQTSNQSTQSNANQVQSVLAAFKAIDDRPVGPITSVTGVAQFDDKMIEKGNLLAGLPAEVAQEVTATLLKKNHAVKESFYNLPVGTVLLPFKLSADPAEGTQQYIKWLQSGVQMLAVGNSNNYSQLNDVPWVSQFAARSGN